MGDQLIGDCQVALIDRVKQGRPPFPIQAINLFTPLKRFLNRE
jgi:hypothetical protein